MTSLIRFLRRRWRCRIRQLATIETTYFTKFDEELANVGFLVEKTCAIRCSVRSGALEPH